MTTPEEKYAELVGLAQLYLMQENKAGTWLSSDAETFQYFKAYALQNQQKQQVQKPIVPPQPTQSVPLQQSYRPPDTTTLPSSLEATTPSKPVVENEIVPSPQIKTTAPDAELQKTPIKVEADPKPGKKSPKESSKHLELEPLEQVPLSDYNELKKVFLEKFPQFNWLETPPSDVAYREQQNLTSPGIIILTYHETGKNLTFLHNLAKAIHLLLGPVEVISASPFEKENKWENLLKRKELRLIITSYAGLQTQPNLMTHFKENAKQGRHFLEKTPLCLLADIGIYMKEPQLKLPLWQSIQSLVQHGK